MTDAKASPPEDSASDSMRPTRRRWWLVVEIVALMALLCTYAGDMPPMVNEAHYLAKAKNYWQPDWCANDLLASSAKAHTTFYWLFGWPTRYFSLETTAWLGRIVGWLMLSAGLLRLCCKVALPRFASVGVAMLWIVGVQYANLAGEWVAGGIEAKVPAYGLVLLALAELADRRWSRVWPLLGTAAAFHVLSGGWAVIAATIAWWATERKREDRQPLITPWLFVGGLISLLGLIPALTLTAGAAPGDATAAARIYAYFRIKHHLLPADFFLSWYLRHAALIAITFALSVGVCRPGSPLHRLRWFTLATLTIAFAGLCLGALPSLAPDLAARLLRYYWFRLSDAMVPLLFAVLALHAAFSVARNRRLIGIALTTVGMLLFSQSTLERIRLVVPPSASNRLLGWDADASPQEQQRAYQDWLDVCRWARESSPEGEVFLTPRHQQSFKWYAHRAEVVNWKDVPQDAASLREWYRRFRDVYPRRLGTLRVTIRYSDLRRLGEEYGVRYMIVDRRVTGENLPLVRLYPSRAESNQTYAVYALPRPEDATPAR